MNNAETPKPSLHSHLRHLMAKSLSAQLPSEQQTPCPFLLHIFFSLSSLQCDHTPMPEQALKLCTGLLPHDGSSAIHAGGWQPIFLYLQHQALFLDDQTSLVMQLYRGGLSLTISLTHEKR